jgi:hypothetical protein
MAVTKISLNEVPQERAKRVSPIKQTHDWIETVETIRKDEFEALKVEFSSETLALGSVTPDRFRRMLMLELQAMGRKNLKVMFRGKSANGAPILYITRGVVLKDYVTPLSVQRNRAKARRKHQDVNEQARNEDAFKRGNITEDNRQTPPSHNQG